MTDDIENQQQPSARPQRRRTTSRGLTSSGTTPQISGDAAPSRVAKGPESGARPTRDDDETASTWLSGSHGTARTTVKRQELDTSSRSLAPPVRSRSSAAHPKLSPMEREPNGAAIIASQADRTSVPQMERETNKAATAAAAAASRGPADGLSATMERDKEEAAAMASRQAPGRRKIVSQTVQYIPAPAGGGSNHNQTQEPSRVARTAESPAAPREPRKSVRNAIPTGGWRRRSTIKRDEKKKKQDTEETQVSDVGPTTPVPRKEGTEANAEYRHDSKQRRQRQVELDPDVPPPPDLVAWRRSNIQPGAVAVPGMGEDGDDSLLHDNPIHDMAVTNPTQSNNGGGRPGANHEPEVCLLNATLVNEEEEHGLSSSVPLAQATPAESDAVRRKRLYKAVGAVVVFVVIVIVVVVAVLVTRPEQQEPPRQNATVVIQLDDAPEETGWKMVCDGFVFRDVPASAYEDDFNKTVRLKAEVAFDVVCEYTIIDSRGNGITNGFFEVYLGREETSDASTLLAEGDGNFGAARTVSFVAREPA